MFNKEWDAEQPSPYDKECAAHLRRIVNERMKIHRKCNLAKWADQFRILRKELSQGKEPTPLSAARRITDSLKWIEIHANEKNVPRVVNAKHFRKVFSWIEERMSKQSQDPSTYVISPDAKSIVEQLDMLNWPKGCRAHLPAAVEESLQAHKKFVRKVHKLQEASNQDVRNFANEIMRGELTPTKHFVENWFNSVWKSIVNWDDWSGNIMSMVFKPDSKRFQKMGCQWSQEWCGSDQRWKQLMKELE